MRHPLRFGVLLVLAIALLLLPLPLQGQTDPPAGAPASPLSSLRLNPQRLKAALDQGNVADAVLQLETGWKQQFDEYYQWLIRGDLLSPPQVAQSLVRINALTQTRSALVYAIAVPNQLEVILLLPDGRLIHHRERSVTPQILTTTADQLRSGLISVNTQESQYLPAAQKLYQWIIEPLKPELEAQQINHLIFCLGRGLRSIPMAVLHDGNQYLIENYSVSLTPAFNLLDRNPARLSGARVLAMGATQFQDLGALPAVPLELSAIAQLWQGKVLLNNQFTLEGLRRERSRYPYGIVHLATHATFVPGTVRDSFIQFWNQRLELDQLRDMGLRLPIVQLLVLSACRTALGDANAELGFAGLAVQSGAKAALASLWAISDAETAVMMIDFYNNLKTAPTKAAALRKTQLAMLRKQLYLDSPSIQGATRNIAVPPNVRASASGDLSRPYYWAGFTLIGNPW